MSKDIKTISTIFFVPTLKIPKDALKENGFINAYSHDSNREDNYTDCIYLLFKPKNLDKFRIFLDEEYDRTPNIIEDYDYPDGYVVAVYGLDPELKEDFKLVKEGKYSQTSKEYQKLFPAAVKIKVNGLDRDEPSLQIRIFRKSTDLREHWENKIGVKFESTQEVWSTYEEEKEILNINEINS